MSKYCSISRTPSDLMELEIEYGFTNLITAITNICKHLKRLKISNQLLTEILRVLVY